MYTPSGLKWIDDNNLVTILRRHFPGLRPSLEGQRNGFVPWKRVRA
jgi:hypothetical protein